MKSLIKASPCRLSAVAVLFVASLFLAGCANPNMQTNNQTATTKSELLAFYAVPFT